MIVVQMENVELKVIVVCCQRLILSDCADGHMYSFTFTNDLHVHLHFPGNCKAN